MHISEAHMKNLPIMEIINMLIKIYKKFFKGKKDEKKTNEQSEQQKNL